MKTKFFLILACGATAMAAVPPEYVAHEWGTFTSVQGADGKQMQWNPFIVEDLPMFVYDRSKAFQERGSISALLAGAKYNLSAQQRMETPVIYFYNSSEDLLDVKVTVDFPEGLVTEWYPRAAKFGPAHDAETAEDRKRSFIGWDVTVLPECYRGDTTQVPNDGSASHYYAARDAKANLVKVKADKSQELVPDFAKLIDCAAQLHSRKNTEAQHEAFLFYRGIGYFDAPLTVKPSGSGHTLDVLNTGEQPIEAAVALSIRGGQGKFVSIGRLNPGEDRFVELHPSKDTIPLHSLVSELQAKLERDLTSAGLYAAEAHAMVATWRDSWFEEEGIRVLYILNTEWTDARLPIKLDPAPKEIVRVMVGRAEVITPDIEWELLKQIVHFSSNDPSTQAAAAQATQELGLGRFAEATARRLLRISPNHDFNKAAWDLLNTVYREKPSVKLSDAKLTAVQKP